MAKAIKRTHYNLFEQIKQTDKKGNEYWSARELARLLDYSEYRHFLPVIERAKEACSNGGQRVSDHFEDILEMVTIGSGAHRKTESVKLSRYACYLIVQNGYLGLCGGLDAKAIHQKKGLKKSEQILEARCRKTYPLPTV